MKSNSMTRCLVLLYAVSAGWFAGHAEAADFASAKPAARVEYWQQRQATIQAQVADSTNLSAVRLVFVGDSITDFWLLGDDPWIPGRFHGRSVWEESFGGPVTENKSLNIGISGDRTEHLLDRLLPQADGGLGQLDNDTSAARILRADGRHQQLVRSGGTSRGQRLRRCARCHAFPARAQTGGEIAVAVHHPDVGGQPERRRREAGQRPSGRCGEESGGW